jgi:hypothetical protein
MPILGTLGSASVSSFGARGTVPGGSSFYNSVNGKGLSLAPSANFAYGTGDFTVEMWIYPQDVGYYRILWAQTYTYNRRAPWYFLIYLDPGARQLVLSMNPGWVVHPTSIPLNAWTHVAVVRQSNVVKLYVNGFGTGGVTIASNLSDATVPPTIGNYSLFYQNESQGFYGYLTNVRVAKSAIYTADFSPSRQPFTRTSQGATNVQLLLNHQTSSQLLTDSSANALTVTNIGSVSFSNFSPYGQPYVNPTPVVIVTATVTPNITAVDEGSTVTFTIAGTNTTNGTYYYTLEESSGGAGTLTAADFNPAALSGSFTITSSSGSIPITISSDRVTEGDDSFTLFVRTGSIAGLIIGNSTVIDIIDTSLTPAFTVNPGGMNEGASATYTVNNLGPAGTYYWTVLNSSTSNADFTAVSGSFTTSTLNGSGSFSVTAVADFITEGPEYYQVEIRTGSTSGTVILTSNGQTINDTSVTNYAVSATPTSINESASTTVTFTGAPNGTYFWTVLNGTTTNADFTATSGSFTSTSGTGSFNVTASIFDGTEIAQSFQVQIRTGSTGGAVVATTGTLIINANST